VKKNPKCAKTLEDCYFAPDPNEKAYSVPPNPLARTPLSAQPFGL